MNTHLKVVTLGGGSSYTPELIEGLIKRYDSFPCTELWLVDIEEGQDKLNIITQLAKRQFKKAGLPVKVYSTLNRREALKDAHFVTTQLRVGGLEARSLDEAIPAKYGVIGQETNGPGGLFKALRTIPVIMDIIKDCEELCPEAWIINFTNPAGIVTQAIHEYTSWKRFIGVCNLPYGMHVEAASLMDVDLSRIHIDMAGLNHLVFGINATLDGKNITQNLLKRYANTSGLGMKNVVDIPWSQAFLEALGYIPCSYLRYYYQKDEMLQAQQEQLKTNTTRAQVVMRLEKELFKQYEDTNLDIKPKELELRGGAYYSDAACNLMDSIYNDTREVQVVNTPSHGALHGINPEDVVEISCLITKDGPIPLTMPDLNPGALGIIQQMKAFEKQATKAAITGQYQDAYLAMVMNPLVQSEEKATLILDEMLVAHKRYLPQFNR